MGCSALVRRIGEAIMAGLIGKLVMTSCWAKKRVIAMIVLYKGKFGLESVPHVMDHPA